MPSISLAPIQLVDYAVVNSNYAVRVVDGEDNGGLTIHFRPSGIRNGEIVELGLAVWVNIGPTPDDEQEDNAGRNNPHTGFAEVLGRFRWIGEEREDRERLMVVNGMSILYGIIRVLIAQASSAGTRGRLVLPAYSFADIEVDFEEHDPADGGEPPSENGSPPS